MRDLAHLRRHGSREMPSGLSVSECGSGEVHMKHRIGWILLIACVAACEVTLSPTCNAQGEVVVDDSDRDGVVERSEAGSDAAVCPGRPRSGITECFPGECGPGQFCDERSGGIAECRPGCTSDEGCGSRDVCVRQDGSAIGRCEPCGQQARRELEGCGAADRSGTTPCFPGQCGPGQYCVSRGMSRCEPGCTSDENCGPTERCEREAGSALGVCRSCDFSTP
jgi:hypothetical protein